MGRTREAVARTKLKQSILIKRDKAERQDGARKTLRMRVIELERGKDIEQLISDGTLGQVAKRLGLDRSTVSKWRLQLGLR